MAFPVLNLNGFIEKFRGIEAARTYLFYIVPDIPGFQNTDVTYFVKSGSLPSSSFDEMSTSMQNLNFKTAGKRNFDVWNVSFYVDGRAAIRKAFTRWLNLIVNPVSGVHAYPSEYMRNQKVILLAPDKKSEILTYTLVKAYPSSVGEIPLDYSTFDYAQFDVSFTYQYHTIEETYGTQTNQPKAM